MGGCEFETEAVAVVGELSGAAGGVTILCGAKSSTLQVWTTWNVAGTAGGTSSQTARSVTNFTRGFYYKYLY